LTLGVLERQRDRIDRRDGHRAPLQLLFNSKVLLSGAGGK
jgi:hypothetical protein